MFHLEMEKTQTPREAGGLGHNTQGGEAVKVDMKVLVAVPASRGNVKAEILGHLSSSGP